MSQVNDVMTRNIASVTPDTPVSQVATMMRDLNIGDVLILENGKLRGIVTDRDLTTQVLTNGAKTNSPVENYMNIHVVTGSPDWSLDQVADVMAKNQIRRLPIVQNDAVLGIVSLGDVALYNQKRAKVGESLSKISSSTRLGLGGNRITKMLAVAVPLALGAAVLVFINTKPGKQFRKQIEDSELTEQARASIASAVKTLQDPRTRQAALDALESTGLPTRTRQLLQDSYRTITDAQLRAQLAEGLTSAGQKGSQQAQELVSQMRNGM